MTPPLHLIMARDLGGGVGIGNELPWKQRGDLREFARLTRGCVVLMGRATLDSLPRPTGIPLPGRVLVTVSRSPTAWGHRALNPISGLELARTLSEQHCESRPVWLIGGARLAGALASSCDEAHLTLVDTTAPADTWMPALDLTLIDTGPWQQGPRDEHRWRQERFAKVKP